jgi:hypothetical protein
MANKTLGGVEVSDIYQSDAEETPNAYVVTYEQGGGGADTFKFNSKADAETAIAEASGDYRADDLHLYSIREWVTQMGEE